MGRAWRQVPSAMTAAAEQLSRDLHSIARLHSDHPSVNNSFGSIVRWAEAVREQISIRVERARGQQTPA